MDFLKDWAGYVGAIVALGGFAAMLTRKGRAFFVACLEARRRKMAMPALVAAIAEDVGLVKKEVMFNGGGSVKDAVIRIESKLANEFWLRPQPAFICDSKGCNIRVTEAYCALVGVRNLFELQSLSWRLFVHPDSLEEYDEAWKTAFSSGAQFTSRARFQTEDGEDRGLWKVRVLPFEHHAGPEGEENWNFTGYFYPLDDLANEIWLENHWK